MTTNVHVRIECERELDGRWIAEAIDLPGVLAYGSDRKDATRNVLVLALRVLADSVEQKHALSPKVSSSF